MSRMLTTDLEHSSEIPIWTLLIGSSLALVIFFGWIVKNISVQVTPDQAKSQLVQPSSETGSSSDTLKSSVSTLELTNNQAINPPDSAQLEPAPIVAWQETVVSADPFNAANLRPVAEPPEQSKGALLPLNSTLQATKTEQATSSALNTKPNQIQRPSADLGALRQLLAEAAAINETEDEQTRAEREQRDELELLSTLSAAIQFAPGSKAASESVSSALNQIQRILADNPETMIMVIVATNEHGNEKQDRLLSQERGRTLIARLVKDGLSFSRFTLKTLTDEQLPANTHKVEIQARSKS